MLFGIVFIALFFITIGGIIYCFVAEDLCTRRHINFIKDLEARTGNFW